MLQFDVCACVCACLSVCLSVCLSACMSGRTPAGLCQYTHAKLPGLVVLSSGLPGMMPYIATPRPKAPRP
jgi:hypothetical protein